MRPIPILTAALLLGLGLPACRGIVAPGRTAGETWGGAYSAQFAKKEQPKPEPKKEAKAGKPVYPSGPPGPHDRAGFVTRVAGDKVWVFRDRTKEWADYLKSGEPAKSAFLLGQGPNGAHLWGPDLDTLEAWVAARPGFETWVRDGNLWVAKENGLDALWLRTGGTPAKHAFLIGAGPGGRVVYAGDLEQAEAYAKVVGN
jgi:hypothetical protein